MIVPRKQKDGTTRWQVRVGKDKRSLGTFDTRKDAKRVHAEWEVGRRSRRSAKTTVAEFLDGYERGERWDNAPIRESSNETVRATSSYLREHFEGVALSEVTHEMALGFARWCPSKAGVRVAKAVFADATKRRLIDANPFAHIKAQKPRSRGKDRVLSVDDLDRLCDKAVEVHGQYGHHFAAMIRFAAYVGPRISMQLALTWNDIDLEAETVTYRGSIGKSGTFQPWTKETEEGDEWPVLLLPEAREALLSIPRPIDSSERIFRNRRGKPLRYNAHSAIWNPVRAAAGLPDMPWHLLRHFAGHHFFVTLGYTAELAGYQLTHADGEQIRETYGHGQQDALERLRSGSRSTVRALPVAREGVRRVEER